MAVSPMTMMRAQGNLVSPAINATSPSFETVMVNIKFDGAKLALISHVRHVNLRSKYCYPCLLCIPRNTHPEPHRRYKRDAQCTFSEGRRPWKMRQNFFGAGSDLPICLKVDPFKLP